MDWEIAVRTAAPEDAGELLEIYRPYVEETAISFEYEVPSEAVFRARIERTLEKYPYIVAASGGRLLGYAYAGPFVGRAAYGWAAETSIYVRRGLGRRGLGGRLYAALEAALGAMNVQNLNACIGYIDEADEYLNRNSAEFHAHLGYRPVGRFSKCGYKFGRWYDMVWMEKWLAAGESAPQPVIPFPQLDRAALARLGIQL